MTDMLKLSIFGINKDVYLIPYLKQHQFTLCGIVSLVMEISIPLTGVYQLPEIND